MKKYKVEITSPAVEDLRESYRWGCKKWGVKKSKQWLREAQQAAYSLSQLPERHSLVSEQEQAALGAQVRQMVFQRYRILFIIKASTVYVLHIRGAYQGESGEQAESPAE